MKFDRQEVVPFCYQQFEDIGERRAPLPKSSSGHGVLKQRWEQMRVHRYVCSASVGLLLTVALVACKPAEKVEACAKIPVVNGFQTVVGEGGLVTLRVPEFARIELTKDCKQARFIALDYLWYEGQLVPEAVNRFRVPNDKRISVNVTLDAFDMSAGLGGSRQPWQFEPAVPHRVYPLEMYPRAYWQEPTVRPSVDPPDVLWGIRGTRDPITHRPFSAACDIVRADPALQGSVVEGDFRKSGDAKCRGWVHATSGTYAVGGIVDVWANGASQVDKIYSAAAKQFETFIKRD